MANGYQLCQLCSARVKISEWNKHQCNGYDMYAPVSEVVPAARYDMELDESFPNSSCALPGQVLPSAPLSYAAGRTASFGGGRNTWQCFTCTYSNASEDSNCGLCDEPRELNTRLTQVASRRRVIRYFEKQSTQKWCTRWEIAQSTCTDTPHPRMC